MKTVNIFIASSIVEFHKERERFVMVMGRLHDYLYENDICNLVIKRCEDYEVNVLQTGLSTQDKLNEQIKESDITLFFFGKKIGSVSKMELSLAIDNYNETGKSKPFVFFMKNNFSTDTVIYKQELVDNSIKYIDIESFDEIIVRTIFYINHVYKFNLDFKVFKDKLWVEDEFIMDDISKIKNIDIIHDNEYINKIVEIKEQDKIKLYGLMNDIYLDDGGSNND